MKDEAGVFVKVPVILSREELEDRMKPYGSPERIKKFLNKLKLTQKYANQEPCFESLEDEAHEYVVQQILSDFDEDDFCYKRNEIYRKMPELEDQDLSHEDLVKIYEELQKGK